MKNRSVLLFTRLLLGILILLNMVVIYRFSSDTASASSAKSGAVAGFVAKATVRDFEEKTEPEKEEIIGKLQYPIRKTAHFSVFASLGALAFLFLSTFGCSLLTRFASSVGFTFLYACTDEFHQLFTEGRAGQFTDVLIDSSGAVFACSVLTLLFLLLQSDNAHKGKKDS